MKHKTRIVIIVTLIIVFVLGIYELQSLEEKVNLKNDPITSIDATKSPIEKEDLAKLSNAEWKNRLTPEQYAVLKEGGTEIPFTSNLLHETRPGTFVTADCGEPVFRSEAKFDSGTGWPSFFEPIKGSVIENTDTSFGMERTEIASAICHSHLGHVFDDAPQTPTGLRYCINGVALIFIPDKK
ncbi:MAG: peptide-methionine (R)-S-oxide reductase MsrB [Patescibacteria group bacterium]